ALVIPAADVNPEGDAGMSFDDRVVEFDARVEHPVRVAAALTVSFANGFIQQRRVLWGINLDVLTSQPRQLLDFAPSEINEVGEIGITRRVGGARLLRVVICG